jgi:hypothetical protein
LLMSATRDPLKSKAQPLKKPDQRSAILTGFYHP